MGNARKLSGKRILITGATGLIGSTLVKSLLEMNDNDDTGMQLTLLVRDIEKAERRLGDLCKRPDVELLPGDVCDAKTTNGRVWDMIVHGAGNAHPLAFSKYPVETMEANLTGTMNLLSHAKRQAESGTPIDKIVFFSSGEIYGQAPMETETGWTEEAAGVVDSMKERSCYPESKRAAETICRSYYSEYGIPAVVARLGYIFGSNNTEENTRADAQFFKKAAAGENIVLKSDGMQLRSYCYAKDAVSAVILLLTDGKPGEAYNVANMDCVVTIREFAQTMADAFSVKLTFDIPDAVERAGYSQMKKEVLNAEKLYDLGWKPVYSLSAAMQDMAENA
ncbi:MAG: NAD(P)-dependent oxidoreductase [Lachnospiraceae bacterium]|nr:NAD(P)-dependent oxidoreductase [Lachnospiraceae bacterium]